MILSYYLYRSTIIISRLEAVFLSMFDIRCKQKRVLAWKNLHFRHLGSLIYRGGSNTLEYPFWSKERFTKSFRTPQTDIWVSVLKTVSSPTYIKLWKNIFHEHPSPTLQQPKSVDPKYHSGCLKAYIWNQRTRSGRKRTIPTKADDPEGRKQTIFWAKADDLWVKADDPGQSRRS